MIPFFFFANARIQIYECVHGPSNSIFFVRNRVPAARTVASKFGLAPITSPKTQHLCLSQLGLRWMDGSGKPMNLGKKRRSKSLVGLSLTLSAEQIHSGRFAKALLLRFVTPKTGQDIILLLEQSSNMVLYGGLSTSTFSITIS